MAQKSGERFIQGIIIVLIMLALAFPAWYVSDRMSDGGSSSVIVMVVIVATLIALGITAFVVRGPQGHGNMKAAIVAGIAALIALGIFLINGPGQGDQQDVGGYPANPEGASSGIFYMLAIVGGPIAFILVMGFAAYRNRSMTKAEEQRSEAGARKLQEDNRRMRESQDNSAGH